MKARAAGVLLTLALAVSGVSAAPPRHASSASPSSEAEHAAQLKYEAERAKDAQEKREAAAGKTQAEGQLHDLHAQLDALAAQQQQAADARSDASKSLRRADGELGQSVRALRDTDAAIAAQKSRLADLQSQQGALAGKLGKQRAELAALVRSAYALGGDEQLKLLLAQDRVVDLARALQYHRYLEADRVRRIRALSGQLQALADLSRQVDAQAAQLATTRQQQAAQLVAVQAQRTQRRQLVATLDAGYRDRAAKMQALGRDADALNGLVKQLAVVMARQPPLPPPPPPPPPPPIKSPPPKPHATQVASVKPSHPLPTVEPPADRPLPVVAPFTGEPGQFLWPIGGRVLQGFGEGNTGLLIAGHAGQDVRAVADGRVAFANWLKGYGLLVIVDHGHGVMSLYANNDALLKNAGDVVRAGEPLATVGSSGGQGRDALYFEVRLNGKAVDPRGWLRAR